MKRIFLTFSLAFLGLAAFSTTHTITNSGIAFSPATITINLGDDINFELIPLQFYDFMEEDNLLRVTPKRKWEYLERATQAIKSQLQIDIGNCKTTDALRLYREFEKMEKNGFTGELKGRILNRAKRLIIYDYLKGIIQ